jgi:hypothetical protein
MQKTIIAIRGQPNSGKTTAIKLAHRDLSKAGKSVYSNARYDSTELKEILEIDGVNVGFASAGDMPDRLDRILRFLLEKGCVVIVCAARLNRWGEPTHKTIDAVEQFSRENGFDLEWIDKRRKLSDKENANRAVADEIVAKVRTAIANVAVGKQMTEHP